MNCFEKVIAALRLSPLSQDVNASVFNCLKLAVYDDGENDVYPNAATEAERRLDTMGLAISLPMRKALHDAARVFNATR